MNKLNKILVKGMLFLGLVLSINIGNVDAKSKVVDTSDIVIYENTEEEVKIDLKNTSKTKQTVSFDIDKDMVKVIKDDGKYYIKSLKPGTSKVKVTVKTTKKVKVKTKSGKKKTEKKKTSKVYTIKVTGLADDGGKTDDLLFEKITNGLKSIPECKINGYENIKWDVWTKSVMNATDYLYSHLDHEFKDHMLSFEYTYDERSAENSKISMYSTGSVLGFIQFSEEGMFQNVPDNLLTELVTYYAVKVDFRDKEIEAAYKESPYVNGVKLRAKNYFLYKMCDRYWSMLDPEVRNTIDPYNFHHWYLTCSNGQDEDWWSIDNYTH